MPKNIIYLTDDYIYLAKTKDKQITKLALPKNLVLNGRVANINKFIEKVEKIIKENNLNSNIFGDKIKIIVSPKYTSADITLLKNIFTKLNFRKIIIDLETKYYKLNKENAWLNIFNNYMILAYINKYEKLETFLIETNFFSLNKELFSFIKNKIDNKELYLLGNGSKLEEIFQDFEKEYGNKTYLFNNHEYYLMECVSNL